MRKERRTVWVGLAAFLAGTVAMAAPPDPMGGGPGGVRVSVEIAWTSLAKPAGDAAPSPLEMELSEGRVLEAVGWPSPSEGRPERRSDGIWNLGAHAPGRVRARLEVPLTAALLLRSGEQVVRLPITAILETSQRTPPQAAMELAVERLAWDSITVDVPDGDGTVAPGATVHVAIGSNVLTPEATSVNLHTKAELRPIRGGEPVWRQEKTAVVATNQPEPSAELWSVAAPKAEGTYLLEVQTTWEPIAGNEGTRLWRWLRRRRAPAAAASASRRTTLVVAGTGPLPAASRTTAAASHAGEQDVETIDLSRLRGQRPSASGRAPVDVSGRSAWTVPEAALVEATRRDRIRGWISRAGPETAKLGPAGASGLAWSALGLRVPHPGRPHRLTVSVASGQPSALGVAVVCPAGPGGRPRLVLDACASGPTVPSDGPPTSFSWMVWPDAPEPIVVVVNRNPTANVQLAKVTLTELSEVPRPAAIIEPGGDASRTLGLDLTGPNALDRFGGADGEPGFVDNLAQARNLAQYLETCGATAVVLPETLADRARRRSLDGQAGEDATGPDRLDCLVRTLERRKCLAWLELALDGPLPGLPDPSSSEALARGLVRLDRQGLADGPAYHPLNAEVRDALTRRVLEAAALKKSRPGLAGVLVRLGSGPTLLGSPDTGLDDATFARFVREMFDAETAKTVPGLNPGDPDRFADRARFIAGSGRMPWLTWRSKAMATLYAGLAAAARRAAPGAALAVVTPGLTDGAVGRETRRVDLAGLAPSHAWRAVGLDLEMWRSGEDAPIVLRGVGLSTDELAHDLATSPELDAQVASRPGRGLAFGIDEEPRPADLRKASDGPEPARRAAGTGLRLIAAPVAEGPAGDEPLGHALAALDPRWVLLGSSAVAGREERVLSFARVLRALPASDTPDPPLDDQPFGVAVRTVRHDANTYLAFANDTPYPIRIETLLNASGTFHVDDLGRGLRLKPEAVGDGQRLVLDLAPFGVSAVRVASRSVKVGPLTPYPSETVRAALQTQYNSLSSQLTRLNKLASTRRGAPPNAGFEPHPSRVVQLSVPSGPTEPSGWKLSGEGMGNGIELDPTRPHSGAGSLRLNAPSPPASVVSEPFTPDQQTSLTIQAWFRSDQPDAKLAVWIEGEAKGRPYRRRAELTLVPDWTARSVRTHDIPVGGLETARLRFELLTAGSVWIDDVTVSGETLTEAERSNARRALLAALHAYRTKRYADFARLASSHWTRHPALVAQDRGPDAQEDQPGMIRTGDASALPHGRRLR